VHSKLCADALHKLTTEPLQTELNGEGEPVWLTPHLRDPQPEGERTITDRIISQMSNDAACYKLAYVAMIQMLRSPLHKLCN